MTANTENPTTTITLEELERSSAHLHVLIHGIENLQQICLDNEANGETDTAVVGFFELCIYIKHLQQLEAILMDKQLQIINDLPDIPPHTHAIANGQHRISKGGKA